MGTWVEIRDGMKTRLATISGLSAYDTMPNVVADKNFAVVLYGEPLVLPHGHGGLVSVGVRVVVRVSRATTPDAQEALDTYLWPTGTNSIVAAVNGDRTLGSKVEETQWVSTGSIGFVDDAVQGEVLFRCITT